MKAVLLHPYDSIATRTSYRAFNPRNMAIAAGIYTLTTLCFDENLHRWNQMMLLKYNGALELKAVAYLNNIQYNNNAKLAIYSANSPGIIKIANDTNNISIFVLVLYSWRISVNIRKYTNLEDVYYGVQIAYFAIIGTQFFMILLSLGLIIGIYKENTSFIIPWVVGFITFMALEAVSMVYSNVLRDHVNREFDVLCKTEVTFFIARTVVNVLAISGVLRFCNLLRAGITWKGPEVIEL